MSENRPFINRSFENKFVSFWIEDGVMMEVFKPDVKVLTLQIAEKVVEDRLKLSNGITMPLFVDLCNIKSIDGPTRKFFATPYSIQLVSVSAFLMHNYVSYYGGKLFLMFEKPLVKTELFRTKSEALAWLKIFVTHSN